LSIHNIKCSSDSGANPPWEQGGWSPPTPHELHGSPPQAPLQIPYIGEEEEEKKREEEEGKEKKEEEEEVAPPKNWILDHWSELLSHNILVE
jgi:hypothetical protein